MGGHSSPPPAIDPNATTQAGLGYNYQAGQVGQAGSTIGQNTPYGGLNYTTSIDPITGQPKYVANSTFSPTQDLISSIMQANQIGIGGSNLFNVAGNFGQYGQNPNDTLLGNTNSLTNRFVNSMDPYWNRWQTQQLDWERNNLLNAGISPTAGPNKGAYENDLDKMMSDQSLTRNAALAQFQPQAFGEATQALNMPINWASAMQSLSQPQPLPQNFINTPGFNMQPVDFSQNAQAAQQEAFRNYQMQIAAQNANFGLGTSLVGGILRAPTGGGGSVGGDLATSIMAPMFAV